ncbi:MAG: hypothetical protein HYT98_05070 [Candidatus Sungbacteria bacterium]|nr:hypothetical protein [Candidatus Sungbacteria bacterium]
MIIVLYGPDTYRSRKKLNEIIAEYRGKTGNDFNLHRLDAKDDKMENIKLVCESGSLFESKKLVVIEYAVSAAESFQHVKSAVEAVKHASDMILILWDGALDNDARGRLKEIQATDAKSQEFRTLASREFRKWMEEEARMRGVTLIQEDFLRFAQYGADLWRIANELDKMALRNGRGTLADQPSSAGPLTIFDLGDYFFTSRTKAVAALFNLYDRGEDEFNTFSYLSNQARNVLLVKACEEQRKSPPKSIAPHPYVVEKASGIARTISIPGLQNGLRRFFEEDFKIKIGLSRPKESLVHMLFS